MMGMGGMGGGMKEMESPLMLAVKRLMAGQGMPGMAQAPASKDVIARVLARFRKGRAPKLAGPKMSHGGHG